MIIDNRGCKHVEIGDKYGRLTVIEEAPLHREPNGHTVKMYRCKCECGNETIVAGHALTRPNKPTISCGCYAKEHPAGTTHGLSKSKIYMHYIAMKSRCYNPNNKDYANYGGRGMKVCNRWLDPEEGFMNFYSDMAPTYKDKLTLDRIDPDGDYYPENCRWAPRIVQCNNTRVNNYITYNGDTFTFTDWARVFGTSIQTARTRYQRGWSFEESMRGRSDNPNMINAIYSIDEFGRPIPQDQIP